MRQVCLGVAKSVLAATLLVGLAPSEAGAQEDCVTTVLVVRHADRRGEDDALTGAGFERAHDLVNVLSKAGLAAIYTSQRQRTKDTADPTVQNTGIAPQVVNQGDEENIVRDIRVNHRCAVSLVVGHSGTIPGLLEELGVDDPPSVDETEYDQLFVVTFSVPETATLTILQYGDVSP